MFAKVSIQSGVAAGTSHRIDRRVARVGSDPQSDICLPSADIPGHALTLEFKDDSCWVYNRCRESVFVGAHVVETDQVAEWPETDILQIGQGTELIIDFDDLEPDDEYLQELENDEPREAESTGDHVSSLEPNNDTSIPKSFVKTAMQLGITLLCIVGCVVLLVRDQNRKSTPDAGLGFSQIIRTALDNENIAPELVARIQYAEAQRIRGRDEDALEHYQSIRDELVSNIATTESELGENLSQILQFVQTRLANE